MISDSIPRGLFAYNFNWDNDSEGFMLKTRGTFLFRPRAGFYGIQMPDVLFAANVDSDTLVYDLWEEACRQMKGAMLAMMLETWSLLC